MGSHDNGQALRDCSVTNLIQQTMTRFLVCVSHATSSPYQLVPLGMWISISLLTSISGHGPSFGSLMPTRRLSVLHTLGLLPLWDLKNTEPCQSLQSQRTKNYRHRTTAQCITYVRNRKHKCTDMQYCANKSRVLALQQYMKVHTVVSTRISLSIMFQLREAWSLVLGRWRISHPESWSTFCIFPLKV